jgi:hypothetical protein
MYPNSPQLGLAGQPVNYAHDTNDVLRTPAYKHVTVVFAVFVAVLVAGTTTAANLIAGKQVIYKPTANALAAKVILQAHNLPRKKIRNQPRLNSQP